MKSGRDEEACAHICLPVLSVAALFFLSSKRQGRQSVIHYDSLPRYIRGGIRLLGISEAKITSLLSALFLVKLDRIVHGEGVHGYRDAHLGSQEAAAEIAEELLDRVRNDPWAGQMARLYGEGPALSYLTKLVANRMFPSLLATNVYACAAGREDFLLVWDPIWPPKWLAAVERRFKWTGAAFFQWPWWYRAVLAIIRRTCLLSSLSAGTANRLLKRSVELGTIKTKRYKLITEFIDPLRFNQGCHDADFLVDHKRLKPSDVLFVLTGDQSGRLETLGYDIPRLLTDLSAKGYEIKRTADYPYTGRTLKRFLNVYRSSIVGILSGWNGVLCEAFFEAWRDYMEFSSMFDHCRSDVFLYLSFPNGRTSIRFNSALITSLCRTDGMLSVNCQTRATHSRNYEYCFDCYDLLLAWGDKWPAMLEGGTMFINKIRTVGCIYLPGLLKSKAATQARWWLSVSIFPSDINPRHHYTRDFAIRLISSCARLANQYPDIQFLVKNKDPDHTKIMLADPNLADLVKSAATNFAFCERPRHDYADLIVSSDIVIAAGFTTPGTEALLLGKRVIFYDELKHGGQVFDEIPNLTAANSEELSNLFKMAVDDHSTYAATIASNLDRLDPYRDAHVNTRIYEELFEEHA